MKIVKYNGVLMTEAKMRKLERDEKKWQQKKGKKPYIVSEKEEKKEEN